MHNPLGFRIKNTFLFFESTAIIILALYTAFYLLNVPVNIAINFNLCILAVIFYIVPLLDLEDRLPTIKVSIAISYLAV